MDPEEFLEEMARIHLLMPDRPLFKLLLELYPHPQVCPTGLIDDEFNDILIMEERTQKYGIFPYKGGQLDQPVKLLKFFDIIRTETARFERDRMVEIEDEARDPNRGK